jgi:enoyl-CoA hydratase
MSGASSAAAPDPAGITVRQDGVVLRIAINRPELLNAVTAQMLEDLAELVEEAGSDDTVRVVVITGTGRAFSSGADLRAADLSEPPGPQTLTAANRLALALRAVPKPVVAAVNGPAAGVGCSIALACDLVVAADTAYFLLAFTDIALMPDGGATALVPASIGRARTMGMALVPERLPAEQAQAWGLIHRAVPAAELDAAVEALVARLAAGPAKALAATKQAINAATLTQLEPALQRELEGQLRLLGTVDFAEGVAAFAARRKPRYSGS